VTEEHAGIWVPRRDQLGISDSVHFIERPFKTKPTHPEWRAFIAHLEAIVERYKFELVIFDTLGALWPVIDENSASETQAALMPLHALTSRGAAVLLVHHFRKSGGEEASASRGSGAICGFADVIVEFRRLNAKNRADRKRLLTTYGRLPQTELVIELSEDGTVYTSRGDKSDANQSDRLEAIEAILAHEPPGMSVDEVLEALEEPKPGKRTTAADLHRGVDLGRWRFAGEGKRNDPFRYWRG
jgi:hypothetical protein